VTPYRRESGAGSLEKGLFVGNMIRLVRAINDGSYNLGVLNRKGSTV
jgi:hypothetical protein